jgi:TatD DNase family protein
MEEPVVTPEALIAEARAAGVGRMITVACARNEWAPSLALAEAHAPYVAVAAGIHPQEADKEALVTAEELGELAQNPLVVGLGETGLDYYYTPDSKAAQRASFEVHCHVARTAGLPVVIHTRDAEEDTLAVLRNFSGLAFELHCFTGTARLAEEALALGGYISLAGIVTFKNAKDLQAIARTLPQNRVLVETDAPYLSPEPVRGRRNAPAHVPHVGSFLAGLWQVDPTEVAEKTTENAFRLFSRLPERPCDS